MTNSEINDTHEFVNEQLQTPVAREVDVLVAGGGIAGCFAAITAARMGARTLVVDRFGQLGGNMGPGLIAGGTLVYFGSIVGGKPSLVKEFLKRVADLHGRCGVRRQVDEAGIRTPALPSSARPSERPFPILRIS